MSADTPAVRRLVYALANKVLLPSSLSTTSSTDTSTSATTATSGTSASGSSSSGNDSTNQYLTGKEFAMIFQGAHL